MPETRAEDPRILSREQFDHMVLGDADTFLRCRDLVWNHDLSQRERIATLEAEIADLKSAPGELEVWLCPPHRSLDDARKLEPLGNCVACIRAQRNELEADNRRLREAAQAKLDDCRRNGDCADAALQPDEFCSDACVALYRALQPAAPQLGMRMSDVRAGMRLRSVLEVDHGTVREFITVTSITERGFQYSMDADMPLGPRYGVMLKDGNEHFGLNGFSLYEIAPAAPQLSGEAATEQPRIWRVRNQNGIIYQTGTGSEAEARKWAAELEGQTLVYSTDNGKSWVDELSGEAGEKDHDPALDGDDPRSFGFIG